MYLPVSGVTSLFNPSEADLSYITGNRDLHVSQVIHKAMLEVWIEKEREREIDIQKGQWLNKGHVEDFT